MPSVLICARTFTQWPSKLCGAAMILHSVVCSGILRCALRPHVTAVSSKAVAASAYLRRVTVIFICLKGTFHREHVNLTTVEALPLWPNSIVAVMDPRTGDVTVTVDRTAFAASSSNYFQIAVSATHEGNHGVMDRAYPTL